MIKIKIIGPRPGEKRYEKLMTDVESRNALETKEMFILLPQVQIGGEIGKFMYSGAKKVQPKKYDSKEVTPLSKSEIRRLLNE